MSSVEWAFLLCNSSAGIAPTCGESIGSADDTPVKVSRSPDLARHETGAKNSNKEPESYQATRTCNQPGHRSWYRAGKQYANENQPWPKAVTKWSRYKTDKEAKMSVLEITRDFINITLLIELLCLNSRYPSDLAEGLV